MRDNSFYDSEIQLHPGPGRIQKAKEYLIKNKKSIEKQAKIKQNKRKKADNSPTMKNINLYIAHQQKSNIDMGK